MTICLPKGANPQRGCCAICKVELHASLLRPAEASRGKLGAITVTSELRGAVPVSGTPERLTSFAAAADRHACTGRHPPGSITMDKNPEGMTRLREANLVIERQAEGRGNSKGRRPPMAARR